MKILPFCAVSMVLSACAGTVFAAPIELNGYELDVVTAGEANHVAGGMVVANGSDATVNDSSLINLSNAQAGAQALNLVTSSNSRVGQGLNVWDGRFSGGEWEFTPKIEQSNLVEQSVTTRSAVIESYERAPNVFETSSHETAELVTDAMDLDSHVMVDTSHSVLGQEVNAGLGVGVSGRVDIELGAADINFLLEAGSEIITDVGVSGEINLPRPFGTMQANGNLHNEMRMDGKMEINLSSPPVTVNAVGSVCYTKLGVCTADTVDKSTYNTESVSYETHEQDTRGALIIPSVEAEYIVIDESSLNSTQEYSVILASGAQSSARAINVVNAAGGSVSNGINVARTTIDGTAVVPFDLIQTNVVSQRY